MVNGPMVNRSFLCGPTNNYVMRCLLQRCTMMSGQRSSMESKNMAKYSSSQESLQSDKDKAFLLPEQPFTHTTITSLPNFRIVCGTLENKRAKVFRSARHDFITETDLLAMKYQLGIRCVVDCRSRHEYDFRDRKNLLDGEYQLFSVKLPTGRNYRPDEPVQVQEIHTVQANKSLPESRHYLIDFYPTKYIFRILCRAPWYVKLCSLFFLLCGYICSTGHKYLVRLIAETVLNKAGLLGQYKDMIDYSQRSICAALKLLTREQELPALVNCAHGKDRTGIVCALLLYCLGKPMEYITAEYALSEKGLVPVKDTLYGELVECFHFSEDFVSAQPETMEKLFDYIIEKYGSVESYLYHIGFGPKEQEMLRHNFQERRSSES